MEFRDKVDYAIQAFLKSPYNRTMRGQAGKTEVIEFRRDRFYIIATTGSHRGVRFAVPANKGMLRRRLRELKSRRKRGTITEMETIEYNLLYSLRGTH